MNKILSLGNTCLDIVMRYVDDFPNWGSEVLFDQSEHRLGGQGANFAIAMARLGQFTLIASNVANDWLGKSLESELESVPLLYSNFLQKTDSESGFTVCVVRRDGERSFLTFLGHQLGYSLRKDAKNILRTLKAGDMIHVSGYFMLPQLSEELPEFLKEVKSKGIRVSLDPGWDPAGFSEESRRSIYSLLPFVDYFEPNESELLALTGSPTIDLAIKTVTKHYGSVLVLKLGKRGHRIFQNGRVVGQGIGLKLRVLDTTGAGDAFDAGFIWGVIKNRPLELCGRLGRAVASVTASRIGKTINRFPTLAEVSALINNL